MASVLEVALRVSLEQTQYSKTRQGVESISKQLGVMRSQLLGLVGFAGFSGLARELTQLADTYATLNARLRIATKSAGEFQLAQQAVFSIAQESRTPISNVADLYSRLATVAGELGASQAELIKFTQGVGQALALSGTDSNSAAGALVQLGQALGSAKIQAEEFNSLVDGAPVLLQTVAKNIDAAGGSVSRLKQLVNQGKLSNTEFFQAFLRGADELQGKFDQLPDTVGGSLTRVKNALLVYVGEQNEATGVTQLMTAALNDLAANFSAVADAAIALGSVGLTVALGRMAGATAASTLQFIAQARAATVARAATLAQAQAALVAAQAENALAAAALRGAEAFAAAGLASNLAAVRQRATAAATALAGAETAVATATAAASRSMIVLRGVLSAFGGPVGLVVTGLSLLYLWFNRSGDAAEDAASKVRRSTDDIVADAKRMQEAAKNGTKILSEEEQRAVDDLGAQITRAGQDLQRLVKLRDDAARAYAQALPGSSIELVQGYGDAVEQVQQQIRQLAEDRNALLAPLPTGQQTPLPALNNGKDDRLAKLRDAQQAVNEEFKARLDAQRAGLEREAEAELISRRELILRRAEVDQTGIADEIADRKAQLAVANAEERAQIEGEIKALEIQRTEIHAQANAEIAKLDRDAAAQRRELETQLLEAQGHALEAQLAEIRAKYSALIQTLELEGDQAAADTARKLQSLEETRAQLDDIERRISEAQQAIETGEQRIANQRTAGLITERDAREQIIQLHKDQAAAIEALIPEYERLAQAAGDRDALDSIEAIKGKVIELRQVTNEAALRIQQGLESGFTDAFASILDGTKSVKSAFADLVGSFTQMLNRMVAEALARDVMGAIFGGSTGSTGGSSGTGTSLSTAALNFLAGLFHGGGIAGAGVARYRVPALAFAAAPRYHSGGIAGLLPDEVPAVLRRGEEVLTTDDPRHRSNLRGAGAVTINIQAQDVASFRRNETEIMAKVGDALRRGSRNR